MRFSSRLANAQDELLESPWSSHVAAARSQRQIGFDLSVNNPSAVGLRPSPAHAEAILRALSDPRALSYQPHPQAMLSAREAVCAHYLRAHDERVDPARVWLASSTSELYAQLFMLHCDPSSEVLVMQPSYPLFESLASLVSVAVRPFQLALSDRWEVNLDALARAVTERTRAIVCVTPNNPTGSTLRAHELAAIAELCAERGLALIVDEVFAEYVYETEERDRARTTANEQRCLCWTLGGLSKSAALPQMKLGWAVLSGPDALVREAHARFEHIADAFLSASAPVLCAAPTMLSRAPAMREAIIERAQRNIVAAREELTADTGASVLPCEGGWTLVLRVPAVLSEDEWLRALLDEDDVLVQPGYFYDFEREAFLIASLLTEPAVFREGVRRIAKRARALV
ncbi:MAG: pyridoxal phosphate-dependent aminotransferase [Polyangiales bacterium]